MTTEGSAGRVGPYRIRLTDLEPRWLESVDDSRCRVTSDPSRAQGASFLCPHCLTASAGARAGVHQVRVWFSGRGVAESVDRGIHRWAASGVGFAGLTLDSSVHADGEGSCGAHFNLAGGWAVSC